MACKVAHKSSMRSRHGCIILHGNRVVACGYNKYLARPYNDKWSLHAEEAALIGKEKGFFSGATMLIVRLGPEGGIVLSKPCERCEKLIRATGIRAVYYSV